MNFDFSQEQKSLQEHARRFLSENCDCAALRASLDGGTDLRQTLWAQMTGLGWPAMSIPESFGGVGLGALEVCVLMEEMGRALMPAPFFSTVCLGVEVLKAVAGQGDAAGKDAAEATLAQIVDGKVVCVDGIKPGALLADAVLPELRNGKLYGRVSRVRDLTCADVLLCPAVSEQREWLLVQLDLSSAGVKRGGDPSLDALIGFGWAELDAVPATVLVQGDQVHALLDQLADFAATCTAFEQVGGAEAAFALAREYALNRYAFGRPIGANQAIKHKLSDMLVRIELARSNAWYAAWAVANSAPDRRVAAATARISGSEAYDFVAEECLQVHGGIGYTWEADCHFHYKRARLLSVALGGNGVWSLRLLNALQDANRVNV